MILRNSLPLAAAALSLMAVCTPQRAEATPIINFTASTYGCFTGSGTCTTNDTNPSSGNFAYAAVNGSNASTGIDANTAGTATIDLGLFSIPTPAQNSNPQSVFDLEVLFTDPLNAGVSPFMISPGTVSGSIKTSPSLTGSITLTFNQTALTYGFSDSGGTGSFLLTLPSTFTLGYGAGQSTSYDLTGTISRVTYTPNSSGVSPVPEPASLLLLGTGMLGTAIAARRRRSAGKKSQQR